jgi:hypothetical protein
MKLSEYIDSRVLVLQERMEEDAVTDQDILYICNLVCALALVIEGKVVYTVDPDGSSILFQDKELE